MFDRQPRGAVRTPPITQREVRATVKWFNAAKGFGFVTPEDGSPDAFLHVSAVQAVGHDSLNEGTTIVCDLAQGARGPQVAAIHSIEAAEGDVAPRSPRAPRDGGFASAENRPQRDFQGNAGSDGDAITGIVKWFNETKGFGFIAPDSGGKDIFVHISALQRSGLSTLAEGDAVRAVVRIGAKGPEAESIEAI
ncbi:MAG: cold-shock protein [Azospirillaceae bacterium]|nr:cold-shock protein [Azospirillaceae bacterium]